MDPCNDQTAIFSDDIESQRHVYEALDVVWPQYANKREHWNATCNRPEHMHNWRNECKIPGLCTILHNMVRDQAYALWDKLAAKHPDKQMRTEDFTALSRRTVQDAIIGPFVRDQVTSILGEVQGDYAMGGDEDEM